jgi:hypothetical protein
MVREYMKVDCPGCGRRISAYVPHRGDGSDVVVVPHNVPHTRIGRTRCAISGLMLGEWKAAEALVARVSRRPDDAGSETQEG